MSNPTTLRHELAIRYELGGRVTHEQLAEDRIEISALLEERFRGARFEFAEIPHGMSYRDWSGA